MVLGNQEGRGRGGASGVEQRRANTKGDPIICFVRLTAVA